MADEGSPGEKRYRIDDLARLAGTTVRNVRAYQDRGLLPPPEKVGRVGWYSEAHLGHLRLISTMLSRGYSLANIAELVEVWMNGQDISDLLGLEAALIAPWGEDRSVVYTRSELAELFAPLGPDHLDEAVALGAIAEEGEDSYRIADSRLIDAANVLLQAGIPPRAVFEVGAEIARATDQIARLYVETISTYLVGQTDDPLSPEQVRSLSEVVRRIRPLARVVVDVNLAAALDLRVREEVGLRLSRSHSAHEQAG